ncbi:MAG: deoxycytidylate deaminase [Nitriliruptoraceae bacterium]
MVGPGGQDRLSFDAYALELAATAAGRGSCVRRRQGAVLVHGTRVVATGHDGGPAGAPRCDEGGCPWSLPDAPPAAEARCIAVHAAARVLLDVGPEQLDGASLYATTVPCLSCATLLATAGVAEVVAAGGRYEGWEEVRELLLTCGVRVRVLDGLEGVPSLAIG